MEHCIETASAHIHFIETGAGSPALIFLHYWGGSARTWHRVTGVLGEGVHSVALDLRGWGQSVALDGRYDLDVMADDLAEMISSLGVRDYILVGHSMGGKLAQLLALRASRGLAGLVLVAPAPPTPMPVPAEVRAAMLESYQSREGVEQALGILACRPLDPVEREAIITDTLKGAPGAKRFWTDTGMTADLGADFSGLRVPVTILVGDRDRVEQAEALRNLYAAILPDAEFRVIEGVGHLSPVEAPEAIAEACRDMLAQVGTPAVNGG